MNRRGAGNAGGRTHLPLRRQTGRWLRCLACPVLFSLCNCVSMDQEYAGRLARAETSCSGTEVTGVWVSKLNTMGFEQRRTLLLRPGGTGRLRISTRTFGPQEYSVTWSYAGGGLWNLVLTRPGGRALSAEVRKSGDTLLYHVIKVSDMHAVFVRADDAAAVKDHLSRR